MPMSSGIRKAISSSTPTQRLLPPIFPYTFTLSACYLLLLLSPASPSASTMVRAEKTLQFSGYDWIVRDSQGVPQEPGPNIYSDNNTFVDSQGRLHLKLTKTVDPFIFRCSQVELPLELGYGTYSFEINQDIHHFGSHDPRGDPNVILGLWLFKSTDNMLHTDFTRWGETGSNSPNLDYCVDPFYHLPDFDQCRGFIQIVNLTYTSHLIQWNPNHVYFQAAALNDDGSAREIYGFWNVEEQIEIPKPEGVKLYISLFMLKGEAHNSLTLNEDLDVSIKKFTFHPYVPENENLDS